MMEKKIGLVWLKKDLRLQDHAPLQCALQRHEKVLVFYVFEPGYWKLPFTSFRQWSFIYDCLCSLQKEVEQRGGSLLFFKRDMLHLLEDLQQKWPHISLYSHEETGGDWTYKRDQSVQAWCQKHDIVWQEFSSNGVVR